MATFAELQAATEAGARSVSAFGWMREEMLGAARLGLVRWKPTTTADAYRRGRWDAIDELRRLTGGRRHRTHRCVPWPHDSDGHPYDLGGDDAALDELDQQWHREEQRQRIRTWADRRSRRTSEVVEAMLEGRTGEQAAHHLGIDPTRVSQILGDSRRAHFRP